MQDIANKYNINVSNISRINKGETHRQENLSYPLRKKSISKNKDKYYKNCIDCGIKISYNSIRCNSCQNKHKTIKVEDMPITRDELKQKIRNLPFTTIAKQYGLTDNGIRKWCDKFQLPRLKKDICKYTDKE